MHLLIGTAALAALVAFVFGETVARWFVGVALAIGALFTMLIVIVTIVDNQRYGRARQPAVYVAPQPKNVWTEARR
mgnify:CR=1 FL=1